jgi:arabinose-5-phosphate isomerase
VEDDLLRGIITDGDLRRAMLRDPNMMNKPVRDFMTDEPVTVQANTLLVDAEQLMQEKKISALIVMGERYEPHRASDICGVLEIYDNKPPESQLTNG